MVLMAWRPEQRSETCNAREGEQQQERLHAIDTGSRDVSVSLHVISHPFSHPSAETNKSTSQVNLSRGTLFKPRVSNKLDTRRRTSPRLVHCNSPPDVTHGCGHGGCEEPKRPEIKPEMKRDEARI